MEWGAAQPVAYFFNESEIEDYMEEHGLKSEDLQLVICEPQYACPLDGNDIFCDSLPEDQYPEDRAPILAAAKDAQIRPRNAHKAEATHVSPLIGGSHHDKNLGRLSRPPGSDKRVPEEHSKKSNHNNAKDKAPRAAAEGLVVAGGQPVGIAHAKLLGRPPASQPHQTLIKIS
jgi:hypothetical protein